jgi:hypothetical protein
MACDTPPQGLCLYTEDMTDEALDVILALLDAPSVPWQPAGAVIHPLYPPEVYAATWATLWRGENLTPCSTLGGVPKSMPIN